MADPTPETAKIQSLEGLRAIMAWWVVIGHVSLTFGWSLPLIDRNSLGVDVFVILSGFVIARLIVRKRELYGAYITRRAFRLFPLYLVVLAVSAAALPIQSQAWRGLPYDTWSNTNRIGLADQAIANLPAHLLAHLPLAQGLIPDAVLSSAAYTIVGQAWSISLEWQFYLLAPLIVWCLGRWRRWPILAVLVAGLMLLSRDMSNAFLGARILHFLLGIMTCLAVEDRANRMRWFTALAVLALALALRHGAPQIIPLLIWAVVIASAIAPTHTWRAGLARLLSAKAAVHLGEMSYSTYLVHMIPLWSSIWILQRWGVDGRVFEISVLLSTIVGAYLIGRTTYLLIEKPGIRLGAALSRRSAAPADHAAAAEAPQA